jgi:hypothetical protein
MHGVHVVTAHAAELCPPSLELQGTEGTFQSNPSAATVQPSYCSMLACPPGTNTFRCRCSHRAWFRPAPALTNSTSRQHPIGPTEPHGQYERHRGGVEQRTRHGAQRLSPAHGVDPAGAHGVSGAPHDGAAGQRRRARRGLPHRLPHWRCVLARAHTAAADRAPSFDATRLPSHCRLGCVLREHRLRPRDCVADETPAEPLCPPYSQLTNASGAIATTSLTSAAERTECTWVVCPTDGPASLFRYRAGRLCQGVRAACRTRRACIHAQTTNQLCAASSLCGRRSPPACNCFWAARPARRAASSTPPPRRRPRSCR